MLDAAVFAAVAVVLGGVVAVTARDGRIVVLGLMLVAVAASLVTSPLPGSLAVTARILGAMLAAYLLWAAAGSGTADSAGSAIGLVAEGAVATAAFAVGLAITPVDPLAGPAEAQAAGLSLIALAVVPLAGRDVFRMGVGVTLLTLGSSLLVVAWSGSAPALEQLALAALLVGIAGATSLLIPSSEADEATEVWAEGANAAGPRTASAIETLEATDWAAADAAAPVEESQPIRPAESERRPRPMTADPLEPDDWLAWGAPEAEPRRDRARIARRAPGPRPAETAKPVPKKRPHTRPNLGGKP